MAKFEIGDVVQHLGDLGRLVVKEHGHTPGFWIVRSPRHDNLNIHEDLLTWVASPNNLVGTASSQVWARHPSFEAPYGGQRKASAESGGLQPHSYGGMYPYAVVGYGSEHKTLYVIEDLVKGGVLCLAGAGMPRQWVSAELAYYYFARYVPETSEDVWVNARPMWNDTDRLIIPGVPKVRSIVHSITPTT